MILLIEVLRAFKGLWEFAIGAFLLLTIVFFPARHRGPRRAPLPRASANGGTGP